LLTISTAYVFAENSFMTKIRQKHEKADGACAWSSATMCAENEKK